MLAAIEEERILTPEMIEFALRRFDEVLKKRRDDIRQRGAGLSALEEERSKLQAQIGWIVQAIAEAGHSPSLLAHLAAIDANLRRLDQRIETNKIVLRCATSEEIRGFVTQNVMCLRGLRRGDAYRARSALLKRLKPLVLTPEETATGPVYALARTMAVPISKE